MNDNDPNLIRYDEIERHDVRFQKHPVKVNKVKKIPSSGKHHHRHYLQFDDLYL